MPVVARDEPEADGCEGADEEGPDEGAVEGARAEEAGGADDAPEDAAVEVDTGDGAGEAVHGMRCTDAGNKIEHPIENTDLRQTRDNGR